jgi:hypothetical protein
VAESTIGGKVVACERQLAGQQLAAGAAFDNAEPIAG